MNVCTSKDDSNDIESLAQIRLAVKENEEPTRKEMQKLQKERNMELKHLLEMDGKSDNPTLYEVRVFIDKQLRDETQMKMEKRGRVFVEIGNEACRTLNGLENEIRAYFRALKKRPLLLSADLPHVLDDGSIFCPGDEKGQAAAEGRDPYSKFWSVQNDEDVIQTFQKSSDFFASHNSQIETGSKGNLQLKRPSILIHVMNNSAGTNSISSPVYLEGMPNPKETTAMTMLSFYSFPPGGIPDPDDFVLFLKEAWEPFDALGRVYIANEGINAQMSIPSNVIAHFKKCCSLIPEMGKYIENGINIDPKPITMKEFDVAGNIDGKPCPPFKNLLLKVREKIVADGLDKSLNWESAGYDMPPLEWHQKLKEAREKRRSSDEESGNSSTPLIFDCRNHYETSVGIFEGAEPLDTENFRDSWGVIQDKLKDKPKDTPIMTYCTGGIRCVKVGAYLTQEMGFTNVSRLAGGIIAYDRTLNEKNPEEEPMFKGTNYVFDGRVGREITRDALGVCITCGGKTNLLSNCKNVDCHKRIVQCNDCIDPFGGCCSDACKEASIHKYSLKKVTD